MSNIVSQLFNIKYPIVQAGMVWCSGWELASAVSNEGGLGIIGSGSMSPDVLRIHIQKTQNNTKKPFGVNVPLMYSRIEEIMQVIVEEKVPVVITSAGNPATWTSKLQEKGIKVVHVVSNLKFALKSQQAGVDAIVAEGVEAGGHNGREETSTFALIPLIRKNVDVPLIAAGGIFSGASMLAAMALGADGVQIGSRFVASIESSAHQAFKERVIATHDGDTRLGMRSVAPVRLIKNKYSDLLEQAEMRCASNEELLQIKGSGRSRVGMFEGNISDGELEIGQVAASIDEILPAQTIMDNIISEYNSLKLLFNSSNSRFVF